MQVKVGEDSELLFKAAAALHVQTPTGDQVKKVTLQGWAMQAATKRGLHEKHTL